VDNSIRLKEIVDKKMGFYQIRIKNTIIKAMKKTKENMPF